MLLGIYLDCQFITYGFLRDEASLRSILARAGGPSAAMIKLSRLDGEAFILNAELIRYVERRPDTFITLTTGERFVVAESMDVVVERAVEYQQRKHMIPLPPISGYLPNPVGVSQ